MQNFSLNSFIVIEPTINALSKQLLIFELTNRNDSPCNKLSDFSVIG